MTTEHKHAAVLRAIADGKVVQWQSMADKSWNDQKGIMNPLSEGYLNWRVKPEPKPDVVRYVGIDNHFGWPTLEIAKEVCANNCANFARLCIDGETGKLKSVEIVE